MSKDNKPFFTGGEWDLDLIDTMWTVIDDIARTEYGLDYAEPQIEIVTADQMLHYHSQNAMPTLYSHWSYGKTYEASKRSWAAGQSSIAYETIINTDPMICYIMADNSATMQALVLAHANCGHGNFFKINYLFKEWTDPKAVLNELRYAKNYIKECEEAYGPSKVELTLDAAHALSLHGIDKYKRRRKPRVADVVAKQKARNEHDRKAYDPVLDSVVKKQVRFQDEESEFFNWPYPEENILYFIEKNSLGIADWQKEIVRLVRKSAQYFYPQMLTKVMNEGWASFWHYTLMERLYELGHLTEGSMMEFYESHTSVCCQQDMARLNPYTLGFNIFMDLKRACENPTEEDYEFLPFVAGKPWLETLTWVAENFKDSDFILEFLGPNVISKLKLFCVKDDNDAKEYEILSVQSKEDVFELRKQLARQYSFDEMVPSVEVVDYNFKGDRCITLEYTSTDGKLLDDKTRLHTMKYLSKLWGNPISVRQVTENGHVVSTHNRKYS